MNELHLFAGIGGGVLGGMLLGHQPVCAVEINKYAQKILLQRQRDGILPLFPIWGDIRTFNGYEWRGIVDIICGGFPCQDISSLGKRKGLHGERSGLWFEMARVISEIQPPIIFIENVKALKGRGLNTILYNLTTMGYDAKWGIIGGFNCGLPHIRERLWIIAYSKTCRSHRLSRSVKGKGNMDNMYKSFCKIDRNLQKFQSAREYWRGYEKNKCPPYLCRVDDGVTNAMDRLECIGNAQIPIVAAYAFKLISRIN